MTLGSSELLVKVADRSTGQDRLQSQNKTFGK
jgi:hypothetical protein